MRWRHIKGRLHSGLEAEIPAEFDIYRTFPAKKPKKGLGWFFPPAVRGEMGNGTSQFLPRSRRLLGAKPPTLLAQLHSNISGVKTATTVRRVSVYEQLGTIIIIGGETRMDDRAMSGHWQRRGTQPWPSSVPPPTSRGEWDLIRPILADTARDKSKSSPISFSGKWSRCKRWRQECTSEGNYASSLLKQTKTSHNNETEYKLNHGWKAKRRSLSKLDKVVSPNSNSFVRNLTAKLDWV